jgi:hypothetical protein
MATMTACGIHVVESPATIGVTMKRVLEAAGTATAAKTSKKTSSTKKS